MDRLKESLIALRRILRATDLHTKKLGKVTNLTTSQLLVLQAIEEAGEMTVGEIGAKVQLAQATVTALVDRLQGMDLVKREKGDTDKRKVYVHLTEAGHAVLDRAPMALHDRFSERFEQLSDWEQHMVISVLQRVAGMMDAEELDAAPLLDIGQVDRPHKGEGH